MCAWHDADAVLLAEKLELKSPAVTGRKGNALRAGGRQGKGSFQKWGVRRKHEAEPVDVANSDPNLWQRGGCRAGVAERDLISGEPNRSEFGRDTEEVLRFTQAYASERKPS